MEFIWSLFALAGSLCAIWVHSNLLKNKCFKFHPKKFSEPTKQDWLVVLGEEDKPVWIPSKSSHYTCAKPWNHTRSKNP